MSARQRFIVVGLVALGLALRGYHYFREPSMWHDEAAVAVNVLSRGYADLLGPLTFHEAAPPLFLWLEKAVCLALGDGVFALRLPAFLASCIALPLLAWAAGRLLDPRGVPWTVFLFAVSEQLAWHACEAKPYAFDVLAAVLLVALYAVTRTAPVGRRLLLFALPAPVLIFLSYPACFLYGGVLAATAPVVWREKKPAAWAAYGLLAATVAGTFLLLLIGPIRAQHDPTIASCWADAFPDWGRPWTVPTWTLFSTLDVFRYCCKPLGALLAPLAVLGAVVLWRGGRRGLVVMLVAPVLLALAAAFAHRYPYGGARVLVYAAPALVLLIGAGTPPAWDWLQRRHRLAPAGLALLFLPPLYAAGHAVVFPWRGRTPPRRAPSSSAPRAGRRRRGQRLDASVLLPPTRIRLPCRRCCGCGRSLLDRIYGGATGGGAAGRRRRQGAGGVGYGREARIRLHDGAAAATARRTRPQPDREGAVFADTAPLGERQQE